MKFSYIAVCQKFRKVPPRDRRRQAHRGSTASARSEEHTSELQSPCNLVCRLLLEKTTTAVEAYRSWARVNFTIVTAVSVVLTCTSADTGACVDAAPHNSGDTGPGIFFFFITEAPPDFPPFPPPFASPS